MITSKTIKPALREAIDRAYRQDETECINYLLTQAALPDEAKQTIYKTAEKLVIETRKRRKKLGKLDMFLHEYDLSSEEGIALMCLAEALLRVPDNETIDKLISDKISAADWEEHLTRSDSLFVNAATWSLLLTGKIYAPTLNNQKSLGSSLKKFFSRTGASVIRPIVLQAMKIIGKQFVMGRTIEEALKRAKKYEALGYRYSYDMLGEAARTAEDAEIYFNAYLQAIHAIGLENNSAGPIQAPGISIKLSALHPRYEFGQHARVMEELVPRLLKLAEAAKAQNIGLTVDAEEADRLDLSLDVIEAVFSQPSLEGWEGFGLALQAYQKRAFYVIDWLADLSKRYHRKLMVRLIKGAYWDAEIKQSQLLGLSGYPVFTRKNSTDVSFIACAKKLFAHPDCFYPQFGTHNAYSVAVILELMKEAHFPSFEFQCLHGMGAPLYDQIIDQYPCRIYAPVGSHKDLLGYLVRRLLENGANTSFINRIADDKTPIEKILIDPVERIANLASKPHPQIPLPKDIYGSMRQNSQGMDFSDPLAFNKLKTELKKPDLEKPSQTQSIKKITAPAFHNHVVGESYDADAQQIENALAAAADYKRKWQEIDLAARTAFLEKAADLFQKNFPRLMALLCEEGGKHIFDCNSEIRETIDFCRYYAASARKDLAPKILPGPTGEFNQLSLHPRGLIVCISPWNFPLAIFAGQIAAALAAGNVVIAKPAEQTPLIASYAVKLFHEAGIPKHALQLLPGPGEIVGARLIEDERVDGVMFTGSTETAKIIERSLAKREGPIVPFIAETGGQNAMIVDSSALPEQVVVDVMTSAFNSAGQRCSALRVLYLQQDIAPRIIHMLQGAMAELKIGDPSLMENDIGPVIDKDALKMLQTHFEKMSGSAKLIYQVPVKNISEGHYFAPCAFELKNLDLVKREIFGPILHVIPYAAKDLDKVLDEIIATGYGLTLGIHSRISSTISRIANKMPVGNIYVNRNMIGAVVGVQPFGGERLSGTGPKAGGPYYIPRLCVEHSISINTTAAGGNAALVSLNEGE